MSTKTDLLQMLSNRIVIPAIQRDYAQGRKGKEYIRKAFLTEIKTHLFEGKRLALDFIYGTVEGDIFYPLDGQQRLTTLWLVYWYISLKADKLGTDSTRLSNFSYETRDSSRDFCKALCERNNFDDTWLTSGTSISEYIKSRTWFYASWLQDPTVSSMLRTISGDGNERSDDNIESVFCGADFEDLYNKLFVSDPPLITFEKMEIGTDQLPVSDDLYIKMNARGKGLTDFENMKADLVAWIQSHQHPDSNRFGITEDGHNVANMYYFPARIDTAWTDVFWNAARKDKNSGDKIKIDEIFFSFINRYLLNCYILSKGGTDDGFSEASDTFRKLYGVGLPKSVTDDIKYEGFDVYKKLLTFDSLYHLDRIFKTLADDSVRERIKEALNFADADDENESNPRIYTYIPYYVPVGDEIKPAATSQKERVYFLAISLFLENAEKFDEKEFSRWMRVVKNLTENAAVESVTAMVNCMRLIRDLAQIVKEQNCDICNALIMCQKQDSGSQLHKQLKEEREKAKKILEDSSWERKIIDAEQYAFFNGRIRFLYTDENDDLCWNLFEQKFNTARILFDGKDVSANTIVAFLKQFGKMEEIDNCYFFTTIGYDHRKTCWKKDILCSEAFRSKVHALLISAPEPKREDLYRSFIESGLIEAIVSKKESYKYRYRAYYGLLHKKSSQTEGVYLDGRKEKCKAFKKYVDQGDVRITDPEFNSLIGDYYWGIRVSFEYAGKEYAWFKSYDNDIGQDIIKQVDNAGNESPQSVCWETVNENLLDNIASFNNWWKSHI